ncbi:MAG: tRNA 4-thiouridine(8) synthase ThiI [Gemmiger sp.]|nr:tRNA 4-thiouridine(8) synthase ThiI [Gemmiger sp.]
MREVILAYEGEMTMKGLNKGTFEARLLKNIRWRLAPLGKFKIHAAQSTIFIEPQSTEAGDADAVDMDEVYRRLSKIFGIVKLSRNVTCAADFDTICATAEKYLGAALGAVKTFKVEAKRADKRYPMTSPEISRDLGAYLLDKHPHLRVNVHQPELEVMVEIRDFGAYIHGPKTPGAGGLPVGTSGRALNLLSGGIDSPVAAYCMARRGLALHHIHFASPPYTSLRAKLKVQALAREISEYTGNCMLFVVPYTKPQEYIRDHAPEVLFTVLMRRSMLRIANLVAAQSEIEAVITGESLAQVASQTLAALACTDAAQPLPVLRPLIGMDKTEIIALSRKIGTFDTSIQPFEDCCTIFTPAHPKTRPGLAEIEAAEAAMPGLAALEEAAAAALEKLPIRMGDDTEF